MDRQKLTVPKNMRMKIEQTKASSTARHPAYSKQTGKLMMPAQKLAKMVVVLACCCLLLVVVVGKYDCC